MEKIGFIGLGIMGRPMAKHLMKAGHSLVVLSKSNAAQDLQKEGAKLMEHPAQLAAEADVIITMLPDSPEVENTVLGENGVMSGIKKGSLFIDMSTIAPSTSVSLFDAFAKRGVESLAGVFFSMISIVIPLVAVVLIVIAICGMYFVGRHVLRQLLSRQIKPGS